jgi:hypothetical protein
MPSLFMQALARQRRARGGRRQGHAAAPRHALIVPVNRACRRLLQKVQRHLPEHVHVAPMAPTHCEKAFEAHVRTHYAGCCRSLATSNQVKYKQQFMKKQLRAHTDAKTQRLVDAVLGASQRAKQWTPPPAPLTSSMGTPAVASVFPTDFTEWSESKAERFADTVLAPLVVMMKVQKHALGGVLSRALANNTSSARTKLNTAYGIYKSFADYERADVIYRARFGAPSPPVQHTAQHSTQTSTTEAGLLSYAAMHDITLRVAEHGDDVVWVMGPDEWMATDTAWKHGGEMATLWGFLDALNYRIWGRKMIAVAKTPTADSVAYMQHGH